MWKSNFYWKNLLVPVRTFMYNVSFLLDTRKFSESWTSVVLLIHPCYNLTCPGLGPGTLVGSAAFDLFPIHAVCVVVPKAGELKKISDIGVWLVELFWSFWAYIWLYIILEVICSHFFPCTYASLNSSIWLTLSFWWVVLVLTLR